MSLSGVSFVIPCLNEESTLGLVLERIKLTSNELKERDIEVIVSDNGSTDRSIEIAKSYNAKVVACEVKGYGANLKSGIRNASNPIVIFADADNTYDFRESPKLIETLEEYHCDLVLGSRLKGKIEKGAMPFLHHYLGTPVLNFLINTFHSTSASGRISDCNSGFRCFYKSKFDEWGVASDGMDFASEMLLKAFKRGANIKETPITLSKTDPNRIPHLRTWQDGMKHLLRFFMESPSFFFHVGLIGFVLGLTILGLSQLIDVVQVGPFRIFGSHTSIVSTLLANMGVQVWCLGALISLKDYNDKFPVKTYYHWLIEIREDKLFWTILFYFLFVIAVLGFVFVIWEENQFQFLNLENELPLLTFFIETFSIFIINLLAIHILKRVIK